MEVFERDIHVKKLCGGKWLWGYDWRIARGTGFRWPKPDIDGWSKQDKLEVTMRTTVECRRWDEVRPRRSWMSSIIRYCNISGQTLRRSRR
jgi:hypothetical protein